METGFSSVACVSVRLSDSFDATVEDVLKDDSPEPGLSRPFLVRASDGYDYWVKQAVDRFARCVCVEQVVGACAAYLGASVCPIARLKIPPEFDGHRLATGVIMRAGIAHGSRDRPQGQAKKHWSPEHRLRDNNSVRHAGYFALCQWCFGNDHQWIYDYADDFATYSHDHGAFLDFPWTEQHLERQLLERLEHNINVSGLDEIELVRLSASLRNVSLADVVGFVSRIPSSWGILGTELALLARFLLCRAPIAARELEQLVR